MERKIGETFEFEGKKIEVRAASRACDGCFLEEKCCIDSAELLGTCGAGDRTDKKDVIFVEVQEQPHEEDEVVKERKVGEVFEYEGHKLKVVEEVGTECHKCFLFSRDCKSSDIRGACWKNDRTDNKSVIFVEVKDEQLQQQAEQSQELNLCEILKNCPKGTELWSDDYRNGWKPDWKDGKLGKYVIKSSGGECYVAKYIYISSFLTFQDEKTANEFLTNFRELIKEAGDLI